MSKASLNPCSKNKQSGWPQAYFMFVGRKHKLHHCYCSCFWHTAKPLLYIHQQPQNLLPFYWKLIFLSCDYNSKLPCIRENACSIMLYFKYISFFKITLMLISFFFFFLQHKNMLPFSWVVRKHLLNVILSRFLYLSWLVISNYTLKLLESWL